MKTIVGFIGLMALAISIQAQSIKGTVYESANGGKLPLPGANIHWVGTQTGTATDGNGKFTLPRTEHAHMLVVSHIGYAADTLHVDPSTSTVEHTMESAVQIAEVVITQRESGAHFSRVASIQTQTITGGELKRAACCNLSESFATNASVDVNYSDAVSGAKQIQLLGLSGIYSQLMIENIPTLRGLGTTYGLSYVPGSWMESIQVSKGTSSVANGFESVTGQVNVEFKKPLAKERFLINGYTNSEGMSEGNIDLGMKVSDSWSTRLFFHSEYGDRRVDHNHDGFLDHPLVKQNHLFNRWFYNKGSLETQIWIKVLDEERTGGQTTFRRGQVIDNLNPYGITIDTRRIEGFFKMGYIFERPGTSLGFTSTVSNHDQDSRFGIKTYNGEQNSYNGNLIFLSYINNTAHQYKVGVNAIVDDFKQNMNALTDNYTEYTLGAYGEYTYKPSERVTVLAGLRADNSSKYGIFATPRMHVKWDIDDILTVRGSVGKGYRSPVVWAESSNLLASSRIITIGDIKQEEAVNYGVNATWRPWVGSEQMTVNFDVYHTQFLNQMVVDLYQSAGQAQIYNLDGRSYSTSAQVEATYVPVKGLSVTTAFRVNDVKTTYSGELKRKPLVSKYKGLFTASYRTPKYGWQLDYTVQLHGEGELPYTGDLQVEHQRGSMFPSYVIQNIQLQKLFNRFDLYVGVENLGNYMQEHPVVAPTMPFGSHFDAASIWGPISGIKYYTGFRFTLEQPE